MLPDGARNEELDQAGGDHASVGRKVDGRARRRAARQRGGVDIPRVAAAGHEFAEKLLERLVCRRCGGELLCLSGEISVDPIRDPEGDLAAIIIVGEEVVLLLVGHVSHLYDRYGNGAPVDPRHGSGFPDSLSGAAGRFRETVEDRLRERVTLRIE